MNKVLNINLGGMPFTMDDEAYKILENYLQALHNHFKQSEGYEEIMHDIENRMGELMSEGMNKRVIAGVQDVKNAISVMGKPEDFGAESITDTSTKSRTSGDKKTTGSTGAGTSTGFNPGKRLMRDKDNKVVSGVCAGLAAYFGIEDPIWIRLLFVVLLFLGGSSFLLYFVLMIIMPVAKTAADKLSMRGEPIDVNSIAGKVSETIESLNNPDGKSRFTSAASTAIGGLMDVIIAIVKFFTFSIGGIILFALFVAWIAISIGLVWSFPFLSYVTGDNWEINLATVNTFFLIAIPTISLILFFRRLFYKSKTSDGVHIGLWSLFFINLFCLGSVAGNVGKEFSYHTNTSQNIQLPKSNLVKISTNTNGYSGMNITFGNVHVAKNELNIDFHSLKIKKSETGEFYLEKKTSSNGGSNEEARRSMSQIVYDIRVNGDSIILPKYFELAQGSKWRNQQIELTLYVPVGKSIKLNPDVDYNIDTSDINGDETDENLLDECKDKEHGAWIMTEKGLKCANEKFKTIEN